MANALPLGIFLLPNIRISSRARSISYRFFILGFTFFIYTSYHLSRKPISVVKSVFHEVNCTIHNVSHVNDTHNCSWSPFDQDDYKELLGSLDYGFLFAYAVAMFFSGHIGERMNLRYFLTIGCLMSGLFSVLLGLGRYWNIHVFAYYLLMQIGSGIFQSTGWPSVVTVVANWFGKGRRGLIMGIWNSHTSVGNILGSLIAGYYVETDWGLSFIVPGIIIGSIGILVFFFLVPHPSDIGCEVQGAEGAIEREVEGIINQKGSDEDSNEDSPLLANSNTDDTVVQIQSPSNDPEKAISLFAAVKIPGVIEFSFCLFFAKLVSYTFLFWLPKYIDDSNTLNLSQEQSADLSTLFDVGGILGAIAAGLISDYTGASACTCFVMFVFAAPMLFVYQLVGAHVSLTLNIVILIVCGFFVNGPYGLITTAVSADLGTHECLQGNSKALSTVTAIIDGTGSMGAALGPLLTGVLSSTGWKNVFYMLIAADICAMVLLIRLGYREIGRLRQRCCGSS